MMQKETPGTNDVISEMAVFRQITRLLTQEKLITPEEQIRFLALVKENLHS